MTGHTTPRTPRTRTLLRRAFAWVAAVGLVGGTAQASAIVRLERHALETRVAAMRDALQADDATAGVDAQARPTLVAQWNNWKNWNNWNNWKNWGNWLNR